MSEQEVYTTLMAALTVQQGQTPAILPHFDWYNNQDQDINNTDKDDEDTFPFPAAFLAFPNDIEWEYMGAKMKEAHTQIELVVVQEQHQDINNHTPVNIRNAGLAWMDELGTIIKAAEANRGDLFDKIKHVNTKHDHNHYEIRTTVLRFDVLLRDVSRQKKWSKVSPSLKVNKA